MFPPIIKPVYLKNSNNEIENIRLRTFQEKFLQCQKNWIFLQTPTGSGKTLAALIKLIFGNGPKKGLFLYPTNELMKDQMVAMERLAQQVGLSPVVFTYKDLNLTDPESLSNLFIKIKNNKNALILISINGKELSNYIIGKKIAKGEALKRILEFCIDEKIKSIICTNMDTLYLIFSNKYKRSSRILELLLNWTHIVVDEFHLYSGIQLANLIFVLFLHYLFIHKQGKQHYWYAFLSATPSDVTRLFAKSFPDEFIILKTDILDDHEPDVPNEWVMIRHETIFHVHPRYAILYDKSDVEMMLNLIKEIIERREFRNYKKSVHVKLLILVNSLTFSEMLYRKLKDALESWSVDINLQRINGLIPHDSRPSIKELKNTILIGTRAVDIGIDFDTPFLIFEGIDHASFMQRLGRGGRHQKCTIHALTPTIFHNNIHEIQKNSSTNIILPYSKLESLVEEALPTEKTYVDFTCSFEGSMLLCLLLYSLTKDFDVMWEIYSELANIIKTTHSTLPPVDDLKTRLFRTLTPKRIKLLSKHLFARGSLVSYPAFFKEFNSWKLLSLTEITKCDIKIAKLSDLSEKQKNSMPESWNISGEDILLVSGISERTKPLFISTHRRISNNKLFFNTNELLYLLWDGDRSILEKYNNLLDKLKELPFIVISNKNLDWRFPQFPVQKGVKMILGESAFLIKFLIGKETTKP